MVWVDKLKGGSEEYEIHQNELFLVFQVWAN